MVCFIIIIIKEISVCFFFLLRVDLKGQIDSLARDYTTNARTLSSEQKLSLLRQIQQSYGKCKEFGDDKVQLAMQTYEMVCLSSCSFIHHHTVALHSLPGLGVSVTVRHSFLRKPLCHDGFYLYSAFKQCTI